MKQITAETFSELENLEEFVHSVDPNSYLARVSLEYLVINSKSDLVETLINRLLDCSSEESREWAEVYKIDHLVYKQEMNLIEAIQQLTYKTVTAPELSTLIKVFQLYNYSSQKEFEMIASLSELVNAEISRLEEGFMKTSLLCRYKITMQNVYLHLNAVDKSRECGYEVLEIAFTRTMKAIALFELGNSFILSDKDKALYYFQESLKISNNLNHQLLITNTQRSINFTCCCWKDFENVCLTNKDDIDDLLGNAYYLIQLDKKEEASILLDQVKLKIDNDYLNAFYQYYSGLITNDKNSFTISKKLFEQAGDYYYKQLPEQAISEIL